MLKPLAFRLLWLRRSACIFVSQIAQTSQLKGEHLRRVAGLRTEKANTEKARTQKTPKQVQRKKKALSQGKTQRKSDSAEVTEGEVQ